jgi:hypothetical protein
MYKSRDLQVKDKLDEARVPMGQAKKMNNTM